MSKIPKKIHYCWFGKGKKDELSLKCIQSWEKKLNDYEFVLWNEDNFDIERIPFVNQAYKNKKWAFVSDYVRMFALYNEGGIYLDTDVEVLKNFDSFLENEFFIGLENDLSEEIKQLSTAVIGSKRKHPLIGEMLKYYENRDFIKNGKFDMTTNVKIVTNICKEKYGFDENKEEQKLGNGIKIYPKSYFYPNIDKIKNIQEKFPHTIAVHHLAGTWLSPYDKVKIFIRKIIKYLKVGRR